MLARPMWSTAPNGQLTLVDGSWKLLPHRREDYRTTQIPVAWDQSAECPQFKDFLRGVFEGAPGPGPADTMLA